MPEKQNREKRSIHIFTETFTEGQWHNFKILKMILIPGDEEYFMLESAQRNRLLMPSKYYLDYDIKPGSSINCRIDKINCSERIFLEPEHPFYQTGQIYVFQAIKKHIVFDRKERKLNRYHVKGTDNRDYFAMLDGGSELEPLPCHIEARLVKIRKGLLIISEVKFINNC